MGEPENVYIALSKDGKFRVDYVSNGKWLIEEFETIKDKGILEITYNANGEVLNQKLLKGEISMLVNSFTSNPNSKILTKDYEEIKITRPCPVCKKGAIKKEKIPIPIIPTYICDSCGSKSYNLTDEYLSKLAYENIHLFSNLEIKELKENNQKFMKELKEYIIRIFASKHITNIK